MIAVERFTAIPDELKALPQWCVWRNEERDGKLSKTPYSVNGTRAQSNNPATWTTYDAAVAAYTKSIDGPFPYDGIKFAFTEGGGLVGVDLDDCRDPDTGELVPAAAEIVHNWGTYAEVSPSGTGVKLWCHGTLDIENTGTRRKTDRWDGEIEIYQSRRFFTVTGQLCNGCPSTLADCTEQVRQLYGEIVPKPEPKPVHCTTNVAVSADDQQVLHRMFTAANGAKARQLWGGDVSGYTSQSEADKALCHLIAFWTGPDADRIDALFRQSGLFRPKWDERRPPHGTYGANTIQSVVTDAREFYEWDKAKPKPEPFTKDGKPRINASNQNLQDVTTQAWEAIRIANDPPSIFRHAGLPARLETDDHGEPLIRTINEDRMRHVLARAAEWYRQKKTEDEAIIETIAMPPRDVVKDVLATPNMPLPKLVRIVEAPVFATDGTICTKPGYHSANRTYYVPSVGFQVPEVPARPTATHIAHAKSLVVDDLISDFPFTGDAERAHAVALFLLAFARDLIPGPTPFHLFEKPSPGTGATLLVDMLAWPAIGRPLPSMTEGRDEDEWRKRLTAKFRGGTQFLNLDNLRRRLDSAALASAITSPTWEDRVLGASEMVRIPIRCIWLGTGNNPGVSSEIARRTIRIRLDAKTDRPWLRSEFRHPNLRVWVRENRSQLVWAALTLIQAWIAEGRPQGSTVLGMFEDWSKTIGGIFDVAGIPGFLGNLHEFYDQSDAEGAAWRGFVADWWNNKGGDEVKVADLWALFKGEIDLPLGDGSEQSQKVRLGKLMADMRDRIFELTTDDGLLRLQIVRGEMKQRSYQWQLVNMGEVHKPESSECVSLNECFPQRPYARPHAHAPVERSELLTNTHQTHNDDEPFEQDPGTLQFLYPEG